jgi:hypothetical protein
VAARRRAEHQPCLPKIQFVLTSHSLIVTGTLEAENIAVARECPAGLPALKVRNVLSGTAV